MPLIKPRTRGKQLVRHITRLDRENNETLYAYAKFLDESAEYVLNQLIESTLAKDKEFVRWRADHGGSFVPQRSPAPKRVRNRNAERSRIQERSIHSGLTGGLCAVQTNPGTAS